MVLVGITVGVLVGAWVFVGVRVAVGFFVKVAVGRGSSVGRASWNMTGAGVGAAQPERIRTRATIPRVRSM
jgi:hypothetical protein